MPLELTNIFFSFQTQTFTSTVTLPTPILSSSLFNPKTTTYDPGSIIETITTEIVVTFTYSSVITLYANSAFESNETASESATTFLSSQVSTTSSPLPLQAAAISSSLLSRPFATSMGQDGFTPTGSFRSNVLPSQTPPPPLSSIRSAPVPTGKSPNPGPPESESRDEKRDRRLAYILPAVLLPLSFASLVAYTIFRRYYRESSKQSTRTTPIPFDASATTDDHQVTSIQNNGDGRSGAGIFASIRRKLHHDEPSNNSEVRDTLRDGGGTREGCSARVSTRYVAPERLNSAYMDSGLDLPATVTRAEFFDISARLADIEAHVAGSPPGYY